MSGIVTLVQRNGIVIIRVRGDRGGHEQEEGLRAPPEQ